MFKYILLTLFLSFNLYAETSQHYYEYTASSEPVYLNLMGKDGFIGLDGADAYPIDCKEGEVLNGRDGEDGQNGEPGENGQDILITYSDLSLLKNISLNQAGGKGSAGGQGGAGSAGCFGGKHGEAGKAGLKGHDGSLGHIYLVPDDIQFETEETTQVLSVFEFVRSDVILTEHFWNISSGAKELFAKDSIISDYYYSYKHSKKYYVSINWQASKPIEDFSKTKMAMTIRDEKLDVSVYSGGVLDYYVVRSEDHFELIIYDALLSNQLEALSLGKFKRSGENLTLVVKEKYRPRVSIDTRFVISIYEYISGTEHRYIGQYEIPDKLVEHIDRNFYLNVGRLNFSPVYKRRKQKLFIYLSIYRKIQDQTRVFGLKGEFKI